MKQLIFILIYNALKHTTNGHILVSTKLKTQGFKHFIKIRVKDSGCGI
jgi:signal transduction histidine kinase